MNMVDIFIACDDLGCTFNIPVYVGIEYMAQTIAAYSGIHSRLLGEQPKLGFLLGSRKYAPSCSVFPNDSELVIYTEKIIQEDSGLCVFDCTISAADNVIVNAKINAFQPPNIDAYLTSNHDNE